MPEAGSPPRQSALRTALAGLIGNVLEWFDFAVYAYFSKDIGAQFFPKSSPEAQQLLAFLVFAAGFFPRPLGSIVLGMVGDDRVESVRAARRLYRDPACVRREIGPRFPEMQHEARMLLAAQHRLERRRHLLTSNSLMIIDTNCRPLP